MKLPHPTTSGRNLKKNISLVKQVQYILGQQQRTAAVMFCLPAEPQKTSQWDLKIIYISLTFGIYKIKYSTAGSIRLLPRICLVLGINY